MIGSKFNFEDIFMRDLTVGVLYTLEDKIKWRNRFSSGDVFVKVPIYYSLSGDERFLLDSFSDDVVSENRYVELNTDTIPRGHLTLTGFNIKSDEFANPNVWLKMVVENEWEIRKVLTQVRAIPITVNYDLEILVSSEIDTFKCSQALMDTMWIYKFIYFEHNFMNIDAVITLPDSNTIQITREKNLTSDNKISVKLSFSVETYYPAWRSDKFADVGYIIQSGDGMSDTDGYTGDGVVPWYMSGVDATGGGVGVKPLEFPYPARPEAPIAPKPNPIPPVYPNWPPQYPPDTGGSGGSGGTGSTGSGGGTGSGGNTTNNGIVEWPPSWFPLEPKPWPQWPISVTGSGGTGSGSGTGTGGSGGAGTGSGTGGTGTGGTGTGGTGSGVDASNVSLFISENVDPSGKIEKTVIPKRSKWYDNILRAREEFRKR